MVIRVICVYRFQIDNGPQEMLHVGRHTTAKARAVARITASNLAPPRRELSNWNRYGLNQTCDARWSHAPTAGG